jgi:hypothetical protein
LTLTPRRIPRHFVSMGPVPCLQEKPLARTTAPVPQTDTGRWEEDSKAIEGNVAKELGRRGALGGDPIYSVS